MNLETAQKLADFIEAHSSLDKCREATTLTDAVYRELLEGVQAALQSSMPSNSWKIDFVIATNRVNNYDDDDIIPIVEIFRNLTTTIVASPEIEAIIDGQLERVSGQSARVRLSHFPDIFQMIDGLGLYNYSDFIIITKAIRLVR